jgi:hypothetical protein
MKTFALVLVLAVVAAIAAGQILWGDEIIWGTSPQAVLADDVIVWGN